MRFDPQTGTDMLDMLWEDRMETAATTNPHTKRVLFSALKNAERTDFLTPVGMSVGHFCVAQVVAVKMRESEKGGS